MENIYHRIFIKSKLSRNHVLLKITVLIISLNLLACVSVNKNSELQIGLAPAHDPISFLAADGRSVSQLVDNDGNLYLTYWDVPQEKFDKFGDVIVACNSSIAFSLFSKGPPLISQISSEMIRPVNYKGYVSCIAEHGFEIVSSDGFYPKGFNLHFNRAENYEGEYMPVGGTIFVDAKSTQYSDMLVRVKDCELAATNKQDELMEDQSFDEFAYVSIEKYVENIMSCVLGRRYKLNK